MTTRSTFSTTWRFTDHGENVNALISRSYLLIFLSYSLQMILLVPQWGRRHNPIAKTMKARLKKMPEAACPFQSSPCLAIGHSLSKISSYKKRFTIVQTISSQTHIPFMSIESKLCGIFSFFCNERIIYAWRKWEPGQVKTQDTANCQPYKDFTARRWQIARSMRLRKVSPSR